MEKLETVDIIDRIAFIEDGINAAHVVAIASSEILTDEERDEALEWVFDKLSESTNALRAELTQNVAKEKDTVRIVRK